MNNTDNNETSSNAGDGVTTAEPGTIERTVFVLKSLIELVENDSVRAEQIETMTGAEIIALAEAEAAKAVEGSQDLIDANS